MAAPVKVSLPQTLLQKLLDFLKLHRLWSNFESGVGAHNASEARTSANWGREGGGRGRGKTLK